MKLNLVLLFPNFLQKAKNESPEFFQDGTVKKQFLYVLRNLEDIMHQIKPEDTYEIQNTYIGQQKN